MTVVGALIGDGIGGDNTSSTARASPSKDRKYVLGSQHAITIRST